MLAPDFRPASQGYKLGLPTTTKKVLYLAVHFQFATSGMSLAVLRNIQLVPLHHLRNRCVALSAIPFSPRHPPDHIQHQMKPVHVDSARTMSNGVVVVPSSL